MRSACCSQRGAWLALRQLSVQPRTFSAVTYDPPGSALWQLHSRMQDWSSRFTTSARRPRVAVDANAKTADSPSPRSDVIDIVVELTPEFKASLEAFTKHVMDTCAHAHTRVKSGDYRSFRVHLPPNISWIYRERLTLTAFAACVDTVRLGTGKERHLCFTNFVFRSEREEKFVRDMTTAASKDRVDDVLLLFERMRKSKEAPSVLAFNTLLHVCRADCRSAKIVFSSMKEHGLTPDQNSWRLLNEALRHGGLLKEATDVTFDHLGRDEDELGGLLHFAGYFGLQTAGYEVIQRMNEARIPPTFYLLSSLFTFFGQMEDRTALLDLWDKISSTDVVFSDMLSPNESLPLNIFSPPSTSSSSSSSSASASASASASSATSASASSSSLSSTLSFSSIASALGPLKWEFSWPMSQSSESTQVPPVCADAMIEVYKRAVEALAKVGCLHQSQEALQCLIDLAKQLKVWEKNLEFIDTVKRTWVCRAVHDSYYNVMKCVLALKPIDLEYMFQLFQDAKRLGKAPAKIYFAMLTSEKVWGKESERRLARPPEFFPVEVARECMEILKMDEKMPSQPQLKAILGGLTSRDESGKLAADGPATACEYLRWLFYRGYPVRADQYHPILVSVNVSWGLMVAKEMISLGVKPTLETIYCFRPATSDKFTEELLGIQGLMREHGLKPDAKILEIWAESYARSHASMPQSIVEELSQTRLRPETYFRLLEGILSNPSLSQFMHAIALFHGARKNGHIPSIGEWNMLLAKGAVLRNLGDTLTLFEQLQAETQVKPNAESYAAAIACLLQSRPNQSVTPKVESFLQQMKEQGFSAEAAQIEGGRVCELLPLLQQLYPSSSAVWRPSVSDAEVNRAKSQHAEIKRALEYQALLKQERHPVPVTLDEAMDAMLAPQKARSEMAQLESALTQVFGDSNKPATTFDVADEDSDDRSPAPNRPLDFDMNVPSRRE